MGKVYDQRKFAEAIAAALQLAATNEKLETFEGAVKRVPGLSPK